MLNQFYIVFEKRELDSFKLKHIQYNIHKRLRELKYVTYRRLDFTLIDENKGGAEIEWDDKKTANIRCYVDPVIIPSIEDKNGIAAVYTVLFDALKALWIKNNWNSEDLKNIYSEIERENFFSSRSYGKVEVSTDKKYKTKFFCELYPVYADYYLRFLGKKGEVVQEVKFLHGHPDPSIFFNFFPNRVWRDNEYFLLSDANKEIFYIFNVNSANFSIEYRPINNSLEECKNYVAAFQAKISQDERMRLLRLPAS